MFQWVLSTPLMSPLKLKNSWKPSHIISRVLVSKSWIRNIFNKLLSTEKEAKKAHEESEKTQ